MGYRLVEDRDTLEVSIIDDDKWDPYTQELFSEELDTWEEARKEYNRIEEPYGRTLERPSRRGAQEWDDDDDSSSGSGAGSLILLLFKGVFGLLGLIIGGLISLIKFIIGKVRGQ